MVGDGVLGRVVLAFHVVIVALGTFKFADVGRVPRIVEVVQLLALLVKLLQIATELQLVDRLQVVITGPRAAELAWVWNAGGRARHFLDRLLGVRKTDPAVRVLLANAVVEADTLDFCEEGPLARSAELPGSEAIASA